MKLSHKCSQPTYQCLPLSYIALALCVMTLLLLTMTAELITNHNAVKNGDFQSDTVKTAKLKFPLSEGSAHTYTTDSHQSNNEIQRRQELVQSDLGLKLQLTSPTTIQNTSIQDNHNSSYIRHDQISGSPDIDKRGKWQMAQVAKYCAKYKQKGLALTLPHAGSQERRNLFRHLLFDNKRRLIFCFIPKIGCSNMRRFLFVLQGIMPRESINWTNSRGLNRDYLSPGIQKASFVKTSLTDSQRLYKVKHFWKFMMVRNPLERLLSAYLNKLSKPLKKGETTQDMFEEMKHSIVRHYHPKLYRQWANSGTPELLTLNFETYLTWIIDTPHKDLNEHFAPIVTLSQPCRIQYNFYGNFKLYSSDVAAVIKRLGLSKEFFIDHNYHTQGSSTRDLMPSYYAQISRELKHHLVKDMAKDLEFYYTLFPEERDTHIALLGL